MTCRSMTVGTSVQFWSGETTLAATVCVSLNLNFVADTIDYIVPVNVALSPCRTLLCSISSSAQQITHTSIHILPRRREEASSTDTQSPGKATAYRVVAALRTRKAAFDVVHALTLPTTSAELLSSTLCHSLTILASQSTAPADAWILQILGVALEVFRYVIFSNCAYTLFHEHGSSASEHAMPLQNPTSISWRRDGKSCMTHVPFSLATMLSSSVKMEPIHMI